MRKILISGANRGIGRKVAERALKDGHYVSLGIRDKNKLKGTYLDPISNNNERILINEYDATDRNSAFEWVEKTRNCFGCIDTVIHCAGKFYPTSLNFSDEKEYELEELWKVNLMGPWILTRFAWDYLLENDNSRIITLVSMSGKRSKSNLAGYTTSKFALMGLCQTMRNEGWKHGVRVTAICPGWVNTDMASNVKEMTKDEMSQPEDLASIISTILTLPNSCVPFEISVNCKLEKS